MQTLFLLLSLPSFALAGWSGKSTAEFHPANGAQAAEMISDNVEYRFDHFLFQDAPGQRSRQELRLYEIHKREKIIANVDAEFPNLTVTAIEPASDKKLWTIEGEYDRFRTFGSYFLASTDRGGDCSTRFRLFSALTGKRLADYSFGISGLPLLLRTDAFRPDGFRFVAFYNAYWTCGKKPDWKDAPKGLELAGVLTYGSPERVIQKLAVFYVNDDPPDDPDSFDLSYKGVSKSFTQRSDSPREYDDWWRSGGATDRKYSGIAFSLRWGDDALSIPLDGDRFNVAKAKGGKRYKLVKEIPEKDWDKY